MDCFLWEKKLHITNIDIKHSVYIFLWQIQPELYRFRRFISLYAVGGAFYVWPVHIVLACTPLMFGSQKFGSEEALDPCGRRLRGQIGLFSTFVLSLERKIARHGRQWPLAARWILCFFLRKFDCFRPLVTAARLHATLVLMPIPHRMTFNAMQSITVI